MSHATVSAIDLCVPPAKAAAVSCQPPVSGRLQQRIRESFQPRWERDWGGRPIMQSARPGSAAVRLDGNDYLGLTGHPDIVTAQVDALRRPREAVVQSGIFQLEGTPLSRLEADLAHWLGHECAVVAQSGYAANLGLLQVVADAGTPVYIDALAHMSMWEGARMAQAPVHAFRHNDPAHLARLQRQHGPGLVAVDSVYSTTGALCPLEQVIDAAQSAGSMMLVDESHALGTHGPQGRGLCAALGLTHRVHFITASLAKAFAGRAGLFTLPAGIRNFAFYQANYPHIFSSGLLEHEVAALAATLEVVRYADEARRRLWTHTRRLREGLAALDYPIAQGTEQIIALEAGPEPDTLRLRLALEQRGVVGAVFCVPATARNRSMVRLTVSASLTDVEVDRVLSVAAEVAPMVRPWAWPAARRQKLAGRPAGGALAGPGPVHTVLASANELETAPIQARDDAQAGRLARNDLLQLNT